jgi:elongation factor Ts
MSNKDFLQNIKKLRELTGVGFKDCKIAIDENNGDIEKSIEFLRKKGIAKASKKMSRTAAEGLALVSSNDGEISVIEINSETDFVAKNKDFISFCKEISDISHSQKGDLEKIHSSNMKNNNSVKDNLIDLIAKIGEKITLRRSKYFDKKNGKNFYYVHGAVEKNIGKIISVVKLDNIKEENLDTGNKLAMHIAASNPLSIDKNGLKKETLEKELEIIKAELLNSGKKAEMVEKISQGKLNKFISDNTLLNQAWIMDPKMKVSDVLNGIKILDFSRYKVGEGV